MILIDFRWSGGSGQLEVPLVRGMPYVTLKYSNLIPTIGTIHAILKVNGQPVQPGLDISGQSFSFEMNNGQTWKVYMSSSTSLTFTGQGFTFKSAFNGNIRVAVVKDSAVESILDQYSNVVPIGTY